MHANLDEFHPPLSSKGPDGLNDLGQLRVAYFRVHRNGQDGIAQPFRDREIAQAVPQRPEGRLKVQGDRVVDPDAEVSLSCQ